ncbi:nucleotidyltransferase family protein [Rhodoplanes sp. Z2-YC6860]|uniref:nucleotidyltransferase family protein n=1 Tax=Rhodoplanes sp. Z2-YC6860 TaxID=674703 RepID=UPI0018DD9EA2|nr:nucleotidyltransferase family protein [Rhodoplanes sp. Z2-YC6860]
MLTAALNPDPNIAARSWREWAAAMPLEDVTSPEMRLLPAVHANLAKLVPTLDLPKKIHGLARMTFAKSWHLVFRSSGIIAELSRFCPVLLVKGLGMLVRFDAWSSRPMADIDIHVPPSALGGALDILAQSGWKPCHGMTFESLKHRSSLRRESWNFDKGHGNLDLHWRLSAADMDGTLESQMWQTAEPVEFAGQKLLLQSPEYAFVTSLHHGFLRGHRSDLLQTVVDAAWLLPHCNDDVLLRLIRKADLSKQAADLTEYLRVVGAPCKIPTSTRGGEEGRQTRPSHRPLPTETALLHRPSLYRLWNALGRRSRIEHVLLKWMGPFSKPLNPRPPRSEYDLRDCAMIDEIAGPGWSWPEPDHSCFWTDRIDARLLIPLSSLDDHLIILSLQDRVSANAQIDIFANGVFITRKHLGARLASAACCLMVPRRLLFGPWVEISLRPRPYLGASEDRSTALSAPARRLRVLNLQNLTDFFSGHEVPQPYVRILKGEQPYVSKFARIEAKIKNSPLKGSSELPAKFDPLKYIFSYPDLFEHEVDPYEHFLMFGRHENRAYY